MSDYCFDWDSNSPESMLGVSDDDVYHDYNYLYSSEKPMEHWNPNEVLQFIFCQIPLHMTYANNLERFRNISGNIFKNLNEYNCKLLAQSDEIGSLIYKYKQKYLQDHQYYSNYQDNNLYEYDQNYGNNEQCIDSSTHNLDNRKKCRKAANQKKSTKLWQFLIHLLEDQTTCPSLIKWENFKEGKFRFVQSDQVAKLWGSRKQNDKMTYEKFSRAMRYYYKSQVLLPVPGKRLVYQFGPSAKGWQNIKPVQ